MRAATNAGTMPSISKSGKREDAIFRRIAVSTTPPSSEMAIID
jgi:hypothetical protein